MLTIKEGGGKGKNKGNQNKQYSKLDVYKRIINTNCGNNVDGMSKIEFNKTDKESIKEYFKQLDDLEPKITTKKGKGKFDNYYIVIKEIKEGNPSTNLNNTYCVLDIDSLQSKLSQGNQGNPNNQGNQNNQANQLAQERRRKKEEIKRRQIKEARQDRRTNNTRIIVADYSMFVSGVNSKRKNTSYLPNQLNTLIERLVQIGLPTAYLPSVIPKEGDNKETIELKNELLNKYLLECRNIISKRMLTAKGDIRSLRADINSLRKAYDKIKDFKPVTPKEAKDILEKQKIESDANKDKRLREDLNQMMKTEKQQMINSDQEFQKQKEKFELDREKEIKMKEDLEKMKEIADKDKLKDIDKDIDKRLEEIKKDDEEESQVPTPVIQPQIQQVVQPVQEISQEKDDKTRDKLKEDVEKELELKRQLQREQIMLLRKEDELNLRIKEQELKEKERLLELELVERKIRDKKIELKDKLSGDIYFDILPTKVDFENTIDYLNKLKLSFILDSDKTSSKKVIVIKIVKYIKLIRNNGIYNVSIDDKGKAINDVIPKIMKIHIKHKKNLIRIIANRNVDQKQIVDHLTKLPIDILNHYHDYIVLLINNPKHHDKYIKLLLQ